MWCFSSRPRRPAKPVRRFLSHRPRLEVLEDRYVPSSAGHLDPTFGAPNGYVVTNPNPSPPSVRQSGGNAVVVQPDGKIVVAGSAPNAKGNQALAVLRYNPDGTLDSTFGSGGMVLTKVGNYRGQGDSLRRCGRRKDFGIKEDCSASRCAAPYCPCNVQPRSCIDCHLDAP